MTYPFVLDLIQHVAVLLAMVVVDFFSSNYQLQAALRKKVLLGLVIGTVTILCMALPFRFEVGYKIDARGNLLGLAGLFFGAVPTLVAMAMAIIYKLMLGEASQWLGVSAILAYGLLGLGWRRYRRASLTTIGLGSFFVFGLVLHSVAMLLASIYFFLHGDDFGLLLTYGVPIMAIYPAAAALMGGLFVRTLRHEKLRKELRDNEERLRLALATSRQGLVDLNVKTGEVVLSDDFAGLLGFEPDEFDVTEKLMFRRVHPEDRPSIQQALQAYLKNAQPAVPLPLELEYRMRRPPDQWMWVHSTSQVVAWDPLGQPLRMISTCADISERHAQEASLRAANEQALASLKESKEMRQALLSTLEDRQQAEAALRRREKILNEVSRLAEVGGWEYDVDRDEVHYTAEFYRMFRLPETMADHKISLSEHNSLLDPTDLTTLQRAMARCVAEGTPFDEEVKSFTKEGQPLWVRIFADAQQVAGRTVKVSGMTQNITARKLAEMEVAKSEHRYRELFEANPQPSWVYDPESLRFLMVNDAAVNHYGYSREEFLAMDVLDIRPKEEIPKFKEHLKRIKKGEDYAGEWIHLTKDGRHIVVEIKSHTLLLDDRRAQLVMVTDITERRRVEEELKRASLVYQHSSEGMLVADAAANIIDINETFTRITGYSREEIIGKNPRILQSGLEAPDFYQDMWQQLLDKGHWQGEIRNRRKDGQIYYEWLIINVVRTADGAPRRYVGQFIDITERKENEELIWRQANFDHLTELPNRHMFQDRLHQEIVKAQRSDLQLALLFLDLDYFKEVNDTLGHGMGDKLLVEAARRIKGCLRQTDTVARLGGDEFMIILNNLANLEDVERVARKLLETLAEPFTLGEDVVYSSASLGITLYPHDAETVDDLMKNADQAMYAAKKEGRNNYHYFTPFLQSVAQKRMRMIQDLRAALNSPELWVAYQPIIELSSGCIVKAEALIRWRHPVDGLISPGVFIPLAEETGLILDVGHFVLSEATAWVQRWRQQLNPGLQISVNVSPVQLQNRNDSVFAILSGLMREQNLPGEAIAMEITEGLMLDMKPGVREELLAFRDAGIQVAMDDFGTGYSSLAYLKKFDIDYLKIDQSFVRTLSENNEDIVLCEAIIVMAHKLGIKVVAEGVETQEQCDLLKAVGCDYAQGFLFSRPVDAESFEALLGGGPPEAMNLATP